MNRETHRSQNPYGQQPQQYDFDHYDLPAGKSGLLDRVAGESFASKLRSPFFATAALLLTGAALAGIIIASYPSSQNAGSIPIVKAEATAYKETPEDKGGMDIPNRDTTVFSTMNDMNVNEKPPVENLLDGPESAEKLSAFAQSVEDRNAQGAPSEQTAPAASSPATAPVELTKIVPADAGGAQPSAMPQTAAAIPSPVLPSGMEAEAASKLPVIHKAGENPETLKFVRSALENKDAAGEVVKTEETKPQEIASAPDTMPVVKSPEVTSPAKIEPASGPQKVTAGSYYIQLASVPSESKAQGEWTKLKTAYAAQLQGLDYRLQKADLGAKGIYYRIQAGPISKESAASLCNEIKTKKPGGCLVAK